MKYKIAEILFILILGLTPLLWFREDNIITGTDVNFSPFPYERLMKRLYTWNPNLLAGSNRTNNMSTLPYIATSGLISLIIANIVTVEKLTYVLWLTLTGFSIYYLLEKIFHDLSREKRFFINIFGIFFYMINFYNVFLWVRLQLNITSLVVIPILYGVLYMILSRNVLKTKDLVILSVATVLGASLGMQPPIIYALIMSCVIFTTYYLLLDIKNPRSLIDKVKKLLIAFIVFVGSGAFWIFPQSSFIFNSNLLKDSGESVKVYNVKELLEWTSKTTNYLNLLRVYGDVVWFDSWGNQPYFPEFLEFYRNNFFMLVGFLLLFLTLTPLLLDIEMRKDILAMTLLAMFMLFFSKGTHPPFESVFEWTFNKIPGFWVHRAPWQKFGIITSMLFAVLRGYGSMLLIYFLNKRFSTPKYTVALLLIILFAVYNNIFILGKMFPSQEGNYGYHEYYNLGFHHKFPQYLYETRNYILQNENGKYFHTLLLPELKTSVYDWGYAGSTDIVSIFFNNSTLFSPYGEGFVLDGYITNVYSNIVSILYNTTRPSLDYIFDFYNIRYILQRNSFTYDFYGDSDSPAFILQVLNKMGISNPATFGKWDLYKVGNENKAELFYTSNTLINVENVKNNILQPLFDRSYENIPVLVDSLEIPIKYNYTYISKAPNATTNNESAECPDFCYTFKIDDPGNYKVRFLEPNYTYINDIEYDFKVLNKSSNEITNGEGLYKLDKEEYFINLKGTKNIESELKEVKTLSSNEFISDINASKHFEIDKLVDILNKTELGKITKYNFSNAYSNETYSVDIEYTFPGRLGIISTYKNYDNEQKIINSLATNIPDFENVDNSKNMQYKYELKTDAGAKDITIYVYELPYPNHKTQKSTEIVNIKVSRNVIPNLILYKESEQIETQSPEVVYEMINPTNYIIRLKEVPKKDFSLIFNQTYNKLWQLYTLTKGKKTPVSSSEHFKSNYFGNGWYLSANEFSEDTILILEFIPQKVFYIGLLVSMGTIGTVVVVFLVSQVKFKKQ